MLGGVGQSQRYLVLLGLLFAALFAAVWFYTATFRIAFEGIDYGQWSAKLAMVDRCDLGRTAIIGDSRAGAAYEPSLLGGDSRNLALTGATPVETFFEVRRIMRCPNTPATFVIAFSPRQYQQIEWLWLHGVGFGQLDFADVQQIAADERRLGENHLYHGSFGSEPPPLMKNWLYTHFFPPVDFASLLAAHGFNRLGENRRIEAETLAQAGYHWNGIPMRCTRERAWEASQHHFHPNPVLILYLQRIIALVQAHHARIVFGPIPLSHLTASAMSADYEREYARFIAAEARAHPGTIVAPELLPSLDDCDFTDAHHLNKAGADDFSSRFAPTFARLII